jgi:tetratricopeptide (TPR) repeat protein
MQADLPEFPNLPPDLENIIVKALERDVTKRYQSIAEFELALETANLGGGTRKRKKKRAPFFTRTRIIVYSSIAIISILLAIITGVVAARRNNAWSDTMGTAEKFALQGNMDEAEVYYKRALEQAKDSDIYPQALVEIHQTMGDMYQYKFYRTRDEEDFDLAYRKYLEAYKDAMAKGTDFQKSHIAEKMGDFFHDSRDYRQAQRYYDYALVYRIKTAGKDSYIAATTESRIGKNYIDEGKYEQAEPVLQHALGIYLGIGGDRYNLYACGTLRKLAINAALAHKNEDALKYFDRAIQMAKADKLAPQAWLQKLITTRDDFSKNKRLGADVSVD